MKENKCKNCGAPLNGYKCEYCGTEYTLDFNNIPYNPTQCYNVSGCTLLWEIY